MGDTSATFFAFLTFLLILHFISCSVLLAKIADTAPHHVLLRETIEQFDERATKFPLGFQIFRDTINIHQLVHLAMGPESVAVLFNSLKELEDKIFQAGCKIDDTANSFVRSAAKCVLNADAMTMHKVHKIRKAALAIDLFLSCGRAPEATMPVPLKELIHVTNQPRYKRHVAPSRAEAEAVSTPVVSSTATAVPAASIAVRPLPRTVLWPAAGNIAACKGSQSIESTAWTRDECAILVAVVREFRQKHGNSGKGGPNSFSRAAWEAMPFQAAGIPRTKRTIAAIRRSFCRLAKAAPNILNTVATIDLRHVRNVAAQERRRPTNVQTTSTVAGSSNCGKFKSVKICREIENFNKSPGASLKVTHVHSTRATRTSRRSSRGEDAELASAIAASLQPQGPTTVTGVPAENTMAATIVTAKLGAINETKTAVATTSVHRINPRKRKPTAIHNVGAAHSTAYVWDGDEVDESPTRPKRLKSRRDSTPQQDCVDVGFLKKPLNWGKQPWGQRLAGNDEVAVEFDSTIPEPCSLDEISKFSVNPRRTGKPKVQDFPSPSPRRTAGLADIGDDNVEPLNVHTSQCFPKVEEVWVDITFDFSESGSESSLPKSSGGSMQDVVWGSDQSTTAKCGRDTSACSD
jgi:hypothetical protein